MPNIMTYDFGDVLLMEITFTNQRQSEKRPAVVISPSAYNQSHSDIIVMPITSQSHSNAIMAVTDWQSAGLVRESFVKPVIGTYEKGEVVRQLGRFSQASRVKLKKELASMLGFKQAT